MNDQWWRAWLFAPLSRADQLHVELAELRRQHLREVALDGRVELAIRQVCRDLMLGRGKDLPEPREMVQTDDWPPIRFPGQRVPRRLPSTSTMIRRVS